MTTTTPRAPRPTPPPQRGRRIALGVAAVVVVGVGLVVSVRGSGVLADGAGGALYAVLVYLLIAGVLPGARSWRVGVASFAVSALVELVQLTGASAAVVAAWGPARFVLGSTFTAWDLAAYAGGAGVAVLVDGSRRGDRRSSGGQSREVKSAGRGADSTGGGS